MKIQEAIKSGKRHRRISERHRGLWYPKVEFTRSDVIAQASDIDGGSYAPRTDIMATLICFGYSAHDIMAEDWETEE